MPDGISYIHIIKNEWLEGNKIFQAM